MQAELNFIRPTTHAPRIDLVQSTMLDSVATERRSVVIEALDLPLANPAEVLAKRGFAALPFEGGFDVESEDPVWREQFANAAALAIGTVVHAPGVMILPSPGQVRRGAGVGADTALHACHGDFTAASAARKFAALQRKHPKMRKARRFAAYNAWWLASEAPQDAPLALCDATTVSASDLVPGSAMVQDPNGASRNYGEIAFYRYNPRHRWYWFPKLTSQHLLVFAGHDTDPNFASQVPHSAFVNPDCPADAPTRVSVECRCFAYW